MFNPFKGYPKKERLITNSGVVESIKELAKLDGAFVISETGIAMAAGRHLDARSVLTKHLFAPTFTLYTRQRTPVLLLYVYVT